MGTGIREAHEIHPKIEEEVEGEPKEGDYFETPDNDYLIVLPRNPELARLVRAILIRLYQLDAEVDSAPSRIGPFRTPTELTESAYEKRTKAGRGDGLPGLLRGG